MSADLLRRAASQIRVDADGTLREVRTGDYWSRRPAEEAWRIGAANALGGAAGRYAGSWRPAVALAVADWLDEEARIVERSLQTVMVTLGSADFAKVPPDGAVAVARAYLGGAA